MQNSNPHHAAIADRFVLNRVPTGPGGLLGAFSLACFAVTLVVVVVAVGLAWESFAAADAALGGSGLQFALTGGFTVLASSVVVAGTSVLGLVFGLSGVLLAGNHPHRKVLWPTLGLAANVLPLLFLGVSLLFLYLRIR